MTPKFVQHDGERWRVTGEYIEDGKGYYELQQGVRRMVGLTIECMPDDKPRTRRLRDGHYVLEFDTRGNVTIREQGRRKRFTTSLAAIYSMTVKAHTLRERKPKGRVSRGLLRR